MANPLPKVRAMLLCQTAQRFNHMWSLQNIFNQIILDRFPATIGGFWVYFNFTGVHAPNGMHVEIDVIDNSDLLNKEISCGRGGLKVDKPVGPNGGFEIAFPIPTGGITFQKPGIHDFKIYFNGEVLDTMSVKVVGPEAAGPAKEKKDV